MRLTNVAKRQSWGRRVMLNLVGAFSGEHAPDMIRTSMYKPDLFGRPCHQTLQSVMRGPSTWTEAERELMGAFVSARNGCPF